MIAVTAITMQLIAAQTPSKTFTTEDKKIEFAVQNLFFGLQSQNSGVVECALRVTATLKMQHPSANVASLMNSMNNIARNNPSGSLRYKAYVTLSVCTNPEWYQNDEDVTTATEETFFYAASSRMQEQLLTVNTQH